MKKLLPVSVLLLLMFVCACTNKQKAAGFVKDGGHEFSEGHKDKAIACYTKAIELDSSSQEAYLGRAWVETFDKKNVAALHDARTVMTINPKSYDAYYIAAVAQNDLKDFDAAISYCNQGLAINAKFTGFYFARADAETQLEDYKNALADYDHDIAITPKDKMAYYFRGQLKVTMSNKAGACADFQKSWSLGNKFAKDDVLSTCN